MAKQVDFESRTVYEISLAVTDSPIAGRQLDSQTRVVINVLDVDDNAPQLSPSKQDVSVVIDETRSGEIYVIDRNDIIDFDSYPENRENIVDIDLIRPSKFNRYLQMRTTQAGWAIVARDGLDGFGEEEIEVRLKLSSKNQPDLSTYSNVLFKVKDVNNNYPTIYVGSKKFTGVTARNTITDVTFVENESEKPILSLDYEDRDKNENARVVFSVDHSNIDYTTVERASGNYVRLYFKQPPDYETEPVVRVKLTAEDRPVESDQKKVTIVEIVIQIIDVDDSQPFFSQVGMPLLSVSVSVEEETSGLVYLDLEQYIHDEDTVENRNNDVFYISDDLFSNATTPSFDIVNQNGLFYLNVTSGLDFEEIQHVNIVVGCRQRDSPRQELPYNERQTAKIVLSVINIDDNPPAVSGINSDGTLVASVFLSESPDTDSIFKIVANDIDFASDRFFYNINDELIVTKPNSQRKKRATTTSKYIQISDTGDIKLLTSISLGIHYIDISLTVSDCSDPECTSSNSDGPKTAFVLRLYPIRESDVVRIESKIGPGIISNNKQAIEHDLSELLLDEESTAIVHRVLSRETGGSEIIVHAWSGTGEVIPPDQIVAAISASSPEQVDFVQNYQVTCVGCDAADVELQDTKTYLIIIGVLSGILLGTIIVALLIVRSMRNKFNNRQHAANVFHDVNAGLFITTQLKTEIELCFCIDEFGSNKPVEVDNVNPLRDHHHLASKYLEDFPNDEMETHSDHDFSVDRSSNSSISEYDEPINEVYTDPIKIERAAF